MHTYENSNVTYPSSHVSNRILILKATGNSFEKYRVYNPIVIASNDTLYMIYRAEGTDTHTGVSPRSNYFDSWETEPEVALNSGHNFGEGLARFHGKWRLYYGVRDQWIEGVTIDIDKLLK